MQTKDKMFINWLTGKQFMWCDTKDSRTHLFFSFLSQFSSFPPSAPVWLISICRFWNLVCGNFFQILLRAVKPFAIASRVQFVFCFVIGKKVKYLLYSYVYDLFPAHVPETNRNDTKRTWNMHEKYARLKLRFAIDREWNWICFEYICQMSEHPHTHLTHTHTRTLVRIFCPCFTVPKSALTGERKLSLVLKAQSQGGIAYFVVFYRLWQNLA